MKVNTRSLKVVIVATLSLVFLYKSFSIGSGGLLNLVPQARVWLANSQQQWTVYVHPFEGSILLLQADSDSCIALDKNKKHAIKVAKSAIKFLQSETMIDVPESTPYRVLKNRPEFNRLSASLVLDDGILLRIDVAR